MTNNKIFLLILFVASVLSASAQHWYADSLGNGYQMRFVDLGKDYQGDARCTLIRLAPESPASHRGVLYIHGYNDYFFQTELGEEFARHGYRFYALDLRRYGRSLRPGDKPFTVRNFTDYFQDVDSALQAMRSAGCDTIVMMAHSTGGLLAAYYQAEHPDSPVDLLVLNSPFLDWNLGKLECFINAASFFGMIFPDMKVSTGGGGVYAEALEKKHHGEWTYNESKKSTDYGVNLAWVRAVNQAQHKLRKLKGDIRIPILLMYSAASSNPKRWTEEASETDVVLDVKDIRKYGMSLGPDVTPIAVKGGMHDLILSKPSVRYPLYDYIFKWLDRELDNDDRTIHVAPSL